MNLKGAAPADDESACALVSSDKLSAFLTH
jgi:hypothetical protein